MTAMYRTLLKRMVAWLCVLAFSLNATVLAHGFVQCRETDGSTRLEWGCQKVAGGRCSNGVNPAALAKVSPSGPSESLPCNDAPVMTHPVVADESVTSKIVKPFDLSSPAYPVTFSAACVPPAACVRVRPIWIAVSPPEMRSLRTVIILV